jgi:glycosyltransferase involved in cell wall biosynthesis
MTKSDLSIIVFAYNEAANIGPVLRELREYLRTQPFTTQLVFVDDGSSDNSYEAAQAALAGANARLLRHESNRGIGAALKSGVPHCEADWVTFMPADGQIAPAGISTLLAAAQDGRVDLVFSNYDQRDDGLHRKLLSLGVRALILGVHGVALRCEGPYLFRRALFHPEELPPDTFFLNFEFPIRMLLAGKRTRKVVIECRKRRSGVSKSTGLKRIAGVARDLIDFRWRRLRERFAI